MVFFHGGGVLNRLWSVIARIGETVQVGVERVIACGADVFAVANTVSVCVEEWITTVGQRVVIIIHEVVVAFTEIGIGTVSLSLSTNVSKDRKTVVVLVHCVVVAFTQITLFAAITVAVHQCIAGVDDAVVILVTESSPKSSVVGSRPCRRRYVTQPSPFLSQPHASSSGHESFQCSM